MAYPLSIGMHPSYYDDQHMLLRMQLDCLAKQECKDFDVWMIDVHYHKRKHVIPELAKHYGLDIKHVPYTPNTRIAKRLDCSIFNAVYCYSVSPRIVRYSCYRFVRPQFTKLILEAPQDVNLDFYFNNIWARTPEGEPRFKKIWNFEMNEVNWDEVPQSHTDPLAAWTFHSEIDTEIDLMPPNCWGNVMVWRRNWLMLNGTDEVFSNTDHYEDIVFNQRARNAGQLARRHKFVLYRLHHQYGGFSHRSNVEVDVPLKPHCQGCCSILHNPERNENVQKRIANQEVLAWPDDKIVVCKECGLSSPMVNSTDYVAFIKAGRIHATILPEVRIGRNLPILCDDMDQTNDLQNKYEIFTRSWDSPRYYQQIA